ncbi:MAG: hypothetical protein JWN74_3069 [Acidobacteriaceae bacterium]|nr:hypothetical protein [Acidobacteriaceae bacterium]
MTLASVVTGRVNDEDGDPMSLIQVVALRKPGSEELEEEEEGGFHSRHAELVSTGVAQTDDRGQYRVFGLKAGEYYIKAIDEYQPMGGKSMRIIGPCVRLLAANTLPSSTQA